MFWAGPVPWHWYDYHVLIAASWYTDLTSLCLLQEIISHSDALYHDMYHSILVTFAGQEIIRGKHIREGGVTSEDYVNFIVSCLCHGMVVVVVVVFIFIPSSLIEPYF